MRVDDFSIFRCSSVAVVQRTHNSCKTQIPVGIGQHNQAYGWKEQGWSIDGNVHYVFIDWVVKLKGDCLGGEIVGRRQIIERHC